MKKTYKGIIKQIVGPVIDVKFEAGFIPALKSAIYFEINGVNTANATSISRLNKVHSLK